MSAREKRRAGTPRRVLGRMVRHYREKAAMSRPAVAAAICKSESLVEAIETGDRVATEDVAADLDRALGLGGDLIQLRAAMAEVMNYQVTPEWADDWPGKEAGARALRSFELALVPGLLQTEEYARAIFRTRLGVGDEAVEELVAARMKRQAILAWDDPPMLWAVIDEAVLRREAGGRPVMCEQMSRLAEAAGGPHVVIQVIPASAGAHVGLLGAFMIADYPDGPSSGYLELPVGGQPIERAEQVACLDLIWNTLQAEALPRTASLALLQEAAQSWRPAP